METVPDWPVSPSPADGASSPDGAGVSVPEPDFPQAWRRRTASESAVDLRTRSILGTPGVVWNDEIAANRAVDQGEPSASPPAEPSRSLSRSRLRRVDL